MSCNKSKIDMNRNIQSLPLLLSNCVLDSPLRVMGMDGRRKLSVLFSLVRGGGSLLA